MVCSAAEMARSLAGSDAKVCVIGDTPSDISAARVNQLDVFAVSTGSFTFEELQALKPDRCLYTIEDLNHLHS